MITLGSTPPPGTLEFSIDLAPVSQQANGEAKQKFKEQVRDITRTAQYLFSGDVKLSVEWLISEQVRYETDRAPDVDNILKPLIDALAGPDGLVIDDNQIQQVSCSWVDWKRTDEQLRIEFRFIDDEWVTKHELVFVQFANGICLPISGTWSVEQKLGFLNIYGNLLEAREAANRQGIPYTWAKVLMPQQRVFHRTRIHGFLVYSEAEFRAQCTQP